MKAKFIICQVSFVVLFATAFAQHTGRVTRVKDGDTFILNDGNKTFTARLNNIDAPELKQNAGISSHLYLNNKVLGKLVEYDSTGKDLYGRTLINAKLEGKRLDSMIIRDGWAWHYVNYSKEAMLDTAMKQAALNGEGLWACGIGKVCPPWLWRKYNVRNKMKYCTGCRTNI
jgi:micrococcal nuclease